MRRQANYQILLAWLLAVIFAVPSVTKAVHIYESGCEEGVHSHAGEDDAHHHSTHDCNTCYVCHFALSVFTEVGLNSSEVLRPMTGFTEFITYQEKGFAAVISSYQLRAPPAA